MFYVQYRVFEHRAVCEIMWTDLVEPDRLQMTIWRTRTAYWITKARVTHSEYVILIAFPFKQWLHKRTSALRYTYTACLVLYIKAIWLNRYCSVSKLMACPQCSTLFFSVTSMNETSHRYKLRS